MARKVLIQIRRGLEKDIGTLEVGELGYCTDTKKLYIGTETGNVLLVAAQTVGDMLKSIYDTDNDGKVDMAEVADKVPWSGITGKPSTFTPSSHTHTKEQITDFPNSLPANGGNADTVDGYHAEDFTLQEYVESYIRPPFDIIRSNLGSPSILEAAMVESQVSNKIWFHPTDKILLEQSDDGITFYERTDITDIQKRRLVGGTNNASIVIPKGTYFRITLRPVSYVWLNWIYMYFSTNGNSIKVKCEKKRDDSNDWITVFDYNNWASGWPAHMFIPHTKIPFSPANTSGHYNKVRITILTQEQSNSYSSMILEGLQWWGGYPAGRRTIYSHDEDKNVIFPADVKASAFKNSNGKEVAYKDEIPTKLSQLKGPLTWNDLKGV